MPSGNKPLPELMLTQCYFTIWHHQATIFVNGHFIIIQNNWAYKDWNLSHDIYYDMETLSSLPCRGFNVFLCCLNKLLNKQSSCWWFCFCQVLFAVHAISNAACLVQTARLVAAKPFTWKMMQLCRQKPSHGWFQWQYDGLFWRGILSLWGNAL